MTSIGVDFDGVIHRYSKGWHDGTIYDGWITGARQALRDLLSEHAVFIFTARDVSQVADWLHNAGFSVTTEVTENIGPETKFWNRRNVLLVTNRKFPAIAYIDDRAVPFTTWDDVLAHVYDIREHERRDRRDHDFGPWPVSASVFDRSITDAELERYDAITRARTTKTVWESDAHTHTEPDCRCFGHSYATGFEFTNVGTACDEADISQTRVGDKTYADHALCDARVFTFEDSEFMVAASEAMPRLIEEVRMLRAVLRGN